MAAQDKQAFRNITVLGGVVVGIALIVYVAWTYLASSDRSQTPPSDVHISSQRTTREVPETDYYSQLLASYNKENSQKALKEGDTFLSTPSKAQDNDIEEPKDEPAPAQKQPKHEYYPPPQQVQTRQSEEQHEVDPALEQHVQGMLTAWSASGASSGLAQVTEWESSENVTSNAGASKASGTNIENTSGTGKKEQVNTIIIPAFYRTPATLKTELDTDENSLVMASISTGPYAGAKVYATGYRRLENTVDMTFTAMKWQGNAFKINAKPVDIGTSRTALSGDVDHHYFSRIIIPAIARGIGNAGDLYEESSQTQVVTPLGGTVTSTGSVDSNEVIGTVVGGAANQTADVLEQDASRIPIKTVHIPMNQTIGIQFIDAVTTDDLLNPESSSMNLEAISKPSEQPELREQTFEPRGNTRGFNGGYDYNQGNQGGFQ